MVWSCYFFFNCSTELNMVLYWMVGTCILTKGYKIYLRNKETQQTKIYFSRV